MSWRQSVGLSGILILAVGLRLAQWQAIPEDSVREDLAFENLPAASQELDHQGQRIADGRAEDSDILTRAPMYPYFLAVIYKFLDRDLATVFLVQALLSAAACWVLYQAGRRFGDSELGFVAAGLAAIYPPFQLAAFTLTKTTLDVILASFLLWSVAVAWRRKDASTWLAVGVACGLMVLLRERWMLILPFVALLAFAHGGRVGLRRNIGLLCGTAVVLAVVAAHVYRQGGDPLAVITGDENRSESTVQELGRFWTWTEPTEEQAHEYPLPDALQLGFGTLCVLAVGGLWWLRRNFILFLPILVFIAGTTTASVMHPMTPSDRLVAIPGVMLLAALPLRALWFAFRERRWWEVAALELLLVAAVLIPWWF